MGPEENKQTKKQKTHHQHIKKGYWLSYQTIINEMQCATSLRKTQGLSFRMPFMSLTFQESNTNAYTYISPPKTTYNHYCNKHHHTIRKSIRSRLSSLGGVMKNHKLTCSQTSSNTFRKSIWFLHTHTLTRTHTRSHTQSLYNTAWKKSGCKKGMWREGVCYSIQ